MLRSKPLAADKSLLPPSEWAPLSAHCCYLTMLQSCCFIFATQCIASDDAAINSIQVILNEAFNGLHPSTRYLHFILSQITRCTRHSRSMFSLWLTEKRRRKNFHKYLSVKFLFTGAHCSSFSLSMQSIRQRRMRGEKCKVVKVNICKHVTSFVKQIGHKSV